VIVGHIKSNYATNCTKAVTVVGYLVNLASGVFIVLAFEYYGTPVYTYTSEVLNIVPCFVSTIFLLDSLRRLKLVAAGVLKIETW
jgi:hypothetical protein